MRGCERLFDHQRDRLRLAPLAAAQVDLPEIFSSGFDRNDFAIFGSLGFQRFFAEEGESAILCAGIGEFDLQRIGLSTDIVDLRCSDGEVEIGTH